MRLVIHLALTLVLACSAAGCFVARSGERVPVEVPPLPESVWATSAECGYAPGGSTEARLAADPELAADEVDLAALHAQTLEAFNDDGWQHREDEMRRRRLVYSSLSAGGLLRVVDDRSLGRRAINDLLGLDWLDDFVVGFRPNATFLSERELARRRERQRIAAMVQAEEEQAAAAAAARLAQLEGAPPAESPEGGHEPAAGESAVLRDGAPGGAASTGSPRAEGSDDESAGAASSDDADEAPEYDLLLNTGVDVRIPLETAPDSKGVMLRLPALVGTKYERRAVERLQELGWTILHVRGPIGVRQPNEMARHEADSRRSARTRLRYKKQTTLADLEEFSFSWDPLSGDLELLPGGAEYDEIAAQVHSEIPMPPTGLEAQPGESPRVVAQRIAAAADAQLAETALAADAALDAVMELHPQLRGRPVVVIGFSAGAISAPAVAVRLGDRVDAVVLIGGGADALTVSQTSSVTHGGVKLSLPDEPEPAPEFVEQVREAYRELAQLDPYNTAPRLGDVPVLQVMARGDDMVPTEHQWTLWERLGRPDRLTWHGPLGHKGLFFFLPGQMGRIDRWVMREIEEREEIQKGRNAE